MDDKRMTYYYSTVNSNFCDQGFESVLRFWEMKKDARLTFRVRSDLKKDVETIANREGHSVAQICEAFLLAGSEAYKKQGTRFVKRTLARLITKASTD